MTLQLGLFAHFAEEEDASAVYGEFLDLFAHAEQLGFESAWLRQFHLQHSDGSRVGGLPSPFVFLSALAARTTRLRLGTAAVTLPLENPLRVAEDAAVLDVLSGGRLELGLANGGGLPGLAEAFGVRFADDSAQRRRDYLAAVDRLLDALAGRPVNASGDALFPPRPTLLNRIWEATLTESSAREAAAKGHGVLVGTTQAVAAEVTAAAYHEALAAGAEPRLGLSTLIFPGKTREAALRQAEAGILRKWEWGREFLPAASTLPEMAASLSVHYGTADDIIESIASQPAFAFTTHLQVQVELVYESFAQRHDAIELFTSDIAPALGWEPARQEALV